MIWLIVSTVIAVCMGTMMIFIRAKAAHHPATIKRILLPPLFMSTGALMFIFPIFRVDFYQMLQAVGLGMVCSIFLIRTTNFKVKGKEIYVIPSKAFIFIVSSLLVIRLGYKLLLGQTIAFGELSGTFYLLALGMIATWRIALIVKFKQIERSIK